MFRKFAVQEERDEAHWRPREAPFDGEKVVCYFSADDRVDFRQLVRELSRELHERIDIVRLASGKKAAVIVGYGHWLKLCCRGLASLLSSFLFAWQEQDLPEL